MVSYLIGKIDQCYIKSTNRCKNNASERQKFKYSFLDILAAVCEDAFIFIHDIGNKAFKNLKQHYKVNGIEPRIRGHKGSRSPKAISFIDIKNVVKFIKIMFCLRVLRWFFSLGSPVFAPPTDSAQNEWNHNHILILIIKRYLQTQFEFNPETFRIFENPLKIKILLLLLYYYKRKKSDVLIIFIFIVRIFFRLFWRHQCMQRSV